MAHVLPGRYALKCPAHNLCKQQVHLYSSQERHLCATERYLPAQYLAIKAEVVALQQAQGCVRPEDVTSLPFKVRARLGVR